MHHYHIAYHPNIQKTKKTALHQHFTYIKHKTIKMTFASIGASMCLVIHTSYYIKKGHPRAQQPRLLASTCSINIEHIIKRIHVRTNETISPKNVHPHAYIYIQVKKYMFRTIHVLSTPVLSYTKNRHVHPSKLIKYKPQLQKSGRDPCSP